MAFHKNAIFVGDLDISHFETYPQKSLLQDFGRHEDKSIARFKDGDLQGKNR